MKAITMIIKTVSRENVCNTVNITIRIKYRVPIIFLNESPQLAFPVHIVTFIQTVKNYVCVCFMLLFRFVYLLFYFLMPSQCHYPFLSTELLYLQFLLSLVLLFTFFFQRILLRSVLPGIPGGRQSFIRLRLCDGF